MTKYKVRISIDETEYFWAIIENSKVTNRNATREELEKITTKYRHYNNTNICSKCREDNNITDSSILYPGNAFHERDRDWRNIGRYICKKCHRHNHWNYIEKNDPNSQQNVIKSLSNRRTGNQDPNSAQAKGDRTEKLVEELYGWESLNDKYNNYTTPIDFVDKDGKLHQVQGRRYRYRSYHFTHFENDWDKDYVDVVIICISSDGKTIERIYRIPFEKEIKKKRKSIGIYKNPTIGRYGSSFIPWYQEYRITDEYDLKQANEIWNKNLGEEKQ